MFNFHQSFSSIIFILWSVLVSASTNPNPNPSPIDYGNTAGAIIVGSTAIVLGLLFLFYGYRILKIVVGFIGFYIFATLAYTLLINLEVNQNVNLGNQRDLIVMIICVVAGGIGALIAVCFLKIGIIAVGAFGGFNLALFLLSWKPGGLIESEVGRPIFIAVISLIGAILMYLFQRIVFIVCTSIIGAASLSVGIDIFAKTGFVQMLQMIITNNGKVDVSGAMYGLLASYLVMVLAGILVQMLVTAKGREYK